MGNHSRQALNRGILMMTGLPVIHYLYFGACSRQAEKEGSPSIVSERSELNIDEGFLFYRFQQKKQNDYDIPFHGCMENAKKPPLLRRAAFLRDNYARDTFLAAAPFGPVVSTSKVTLSPSFNSSNVTPFNASEWKNRSFGSPSREMNPNLLSLTRVLIVPFIRLFLWLYMTHSEIGL